MKPSVKTLAGLTLIATLGDGTVIAANPNLAGLGGEVKSASLRAPEGVESEAQLARLARIDRAQPEALAALPGTVTKAKLDDENGFLVWQIDIEHPFWCWWRRLPPQAAVIWRRDLHRDGGLGARGVSRVDCWATGCGKARHGVAADQAGRQTVAWGARVTAVPATDRG
jgi:hypothetical protein